MNRRNLLVAALVAECAFAGTAQAQSIQIWGVDPATKVLRGALPPASAEGPLLEGARGEVVSGQIAIRSDRDLKRVNLKLFGAKSSPLGALNMRWERYIPFKRNSFGVPADEFIAKAPVDLPDPFWEEPVVDIAKDATQALWLEVRIPKDEAAGVYDKDLLISWDGGKATIRIKLRVYDFDMPAERHQQVTNWFDFPGGGYKVAEFGPEYWALLDKFAKIMVEHRQTCFRTYLSLIKTTFDKRKGFVCDFTNLDRWAKTFFDAGMERMEMFQVGAVTTNVLDTKAVINPVDIAVDVKDPNVKLTAEQKLRGVLKQLEKHLKAKGWDRRTMMHVNDEPFIHLLPSYKRIAKLTREEAPSLKLIEAIETTGFGDSLDVQVPKLNHMNLWWPYFEKTKAQGKEVWFYTCCHPLGRYPNRFIDQPLVETRLLHWISYLYGLDGYLHWGLNWYAPGFDPYSEEAVSQDVTLGDRAIMYPGKDGPVGSIRWSAMRDGLQDYEYLWVLEQRLTSIKKRLGAKADWIDPRQRPTELCRRVAWSFYDFTRSSAVLLDTRRAIAEEIEAAGKKNYLYVQTEPMEGTSLPYGLRLVNVRGFAEPGSTITIDGEPVVNVAEDGSFVAYRFVDRPTVTFEATKDGAKTTVTRQFKPVE